MFRPILYLGFSKGVVLPFTSLDLQLLYEGLKGSRLLFMKIYFLPNPNTINALLQNTDFDFSFIQFSSGKIMWGSVVAIMGPTPD